MICLIKLFVITFFNNRIPTKKSILIHHIALTLLRQKRRLDNTLILRRIHKEYKYKTNSCKESVGKIAII